MRSESKHFRARKTIRHDTPPSSAMQAHHNRPQRGAAAAAVIGIREGYESNFGVSDDKEARYQRRRASARDPRARERSDVRTNTPHGPRTAPPPTGGADVTSDDEQVEVEEEDSSDDPEALLTTVQASLNRIQNAVERKRKRARDENDLVITELRQRLSSAEDRASTAQDEHFALAVRHDQTKELLQTSRLEHTNLRDEYVALERRHDQTREWLRTSRSENTNLRTEARFKAEETLRAMEDNQTKLSAVEARNATLTTVAADERSLREVQLLKLRASCCCLHDYTDDPTPPGPYDSRIVATCSGDVSHGICGDCIDQQVEAHMNDPNVQLSCMAPCKPGGVRCGASFCYIKPPDFEQAITFAKAEARSEERLKTLPVQQEATATITGLRRDLAAATAEANASDAASVRESVLEQLRSKAAIMSPCCGALAFGTFSNCTALECSVCDEETGQRTSGCGRSFCAWCFEVMPYGTDAHDHIYLHCKINPTRFNAGGGDVPGAGGGNGEIRGCLFANTKRLDTYLTAIWRAKQAEQIAGLLQLQLAQGSSLG